MTETKMLPLPKWCYSDKHLHVGSGAIRKEVRGYSSAVAKHNVAARDAEIKALRAEVDQAQASARVWRRLAETTEARAERLAEALREKADKWDRLGDEHGVRQFTGNDHKLFANELRALLRDHDQEASDEE